MYTSWQQEVVSTFILGMAGWFILSMVLMPVLGFPVAAIALLAGAPILHVIAYSILVPWVLSLVIAMSACFLNLMWEEL